MSRKSYSVSNSQFGNTAFNIQQAKSVDEQPEPNEPSIAAWYLQKCAHLGSRLPATTPVLKNSQPYRLVLHKFEGLNIVKKSAHSNLYLELTATFITDGMMVIGNTCHYLSQVPVTNSGRLSKPVCLYYHSRVDRAYSDIRMAIRFVLVQMRDGLVQGSYPQGVTVIKAPFVEEELTDVSVLKEVSELEVVSNALTRVNAGQMSFSYRIQLSSYLKSLTKFIPSQTIVTSQTKITGLLDNHAPEDPQSSIQQSPMLFLNVQALQIHISQKFQAQVLTQIRQLETPNPQPTPNTPSLTRKIVCGFHNEFHLVSASTRTLQQIDKITTGQSVIIIYEALTNNQVLKIPYYLPSEQLEYNCALGLSLVYAYGQCEYEVAMFALQPKLDSTRIEISDSMVLGAGVGLYCSSLGVRNVKPPTIIVEYMSEDGLKVREQEWKEKQLRNLTSSHKMKTREYLESEKYIQELEKQRLSLEKEKEELQYLKTQNFVNYQQQFEKRLEQQRIMLRKRQEMIEAQYRQEVQRQIRHKKQLQMQIMAMKERIVAIQQSRKMQQPSSGRVSYNDPADQINYSQEPLITMGTTFQRQKINPNYLVQAQRAIPTRQVRQIIGKTIQTNNEAIQKQSRQFNYASKFTFVFNSVIWPLGATPPSEFYFVIRFFNFREFRTDPLTATDSNTEYRQLVRLNPYRLNMQQTLPSYQFVVDPSQYANPEIIQSDMVQFMARNYTIVDIFDARTYLYLGQFNIRMHDLFRGSKNQVMTAKQYAITKIKGSQSGLIQVLIKNQQVQCKEEVSLKDRRKVKELKKKVISNNPIAISNQIMATKGVQNVPSGKDSIKNRQQKRIQLFKKRMLQAKADRNFSDYEPQEKAKIVQKITEYKQKKMPQFINKIYEQLLSEHITINPQFGQSKTFFYQFTNISQLPSSFRVTIQSPETSLALVKDPQEWKFFASQFGYPTPKLYDCINAQNSFYLSAGETIPLLFKYVCFEQSERGRQKTQTVAVTKQQNNWIVGGFTLEVQSHESIINHSYVLYQPGNQTVDLILPVIYSSNDTRMPKKLYLTVEEAAAEWLNEFEILLKIKTPQIMDRLKFNLLLYEDDYFCRMRQNWLIEVHAYEGVCAVCRPDEKTKFKISIPEHVIAYFRPNSVYFSCSSSDIVFENDKIGYAGLMKGSVEVWCELLPEAIEAGTMQITCVSDRKQLVYGWIVQVYSYSPKIV